jgi:vancomycin resistance protein YoaR
MIISICALVLVVLLGTILVVSKVFGSPKAEDNGLILSGVTVAGIDLGGMTPEEAQMALYRVADNTYPVKSMIVTMPDGTLELKPGNTGARLDVVALVDAVYNYGRTGSSSEIQKAQQNAQMGRGHNVALLPYLDLDTGYIRDMVDDYCDYFNSEYAPSSVKVKGDKPALKGDEFDENAPCQTIQIALGNPGRELDADRVYDQILDAYSFCEFEVRAEEASPEQLPDPIDLNKVFKENCSTPIDAYMDMQSFEVVVETYGYTFDLEKAQAELDALEYGESMEIRLEYIIPEIKAKELEEMLFRDVLASCETKTTNDHNRNTNLKLACQAINGTLLDPGDTFSFNDVVGKRTESAGYKEAGAFFGGESVKELGGGICQVSSTLYACVLAADLDVIDRTPHSTPVSYLPKGMDATVSWGGPEFKFRNDTDYPIRIDAEVSGGMVKIKLIGTDERDYYVKIECRESEVLEPETKYEDFTWDNAEGYKDGDVIKAGTTGYVIKTYKIKYNKADNSLIGERVEATSTYKSKEQVVARVEPKPTEPPTEAPSEESSGSAFDDLESIFDSILDGI